MQGCFVQTVAHFFPEEFLSSLGSLSVEVIELSYSQKGSMISISSYRPVLLTSIISKIFEIILTRVMHGNLKLNKPISIEHHSSFRQKHILLLFLKAEIYHQMHYINIENWSSLHRLHEGIR